MNPLSAPTPGFVHVDLDGLWTLAGCYGYPENLGGAPGDPAGDSFKNDPVFSHALPRLLGLFDELGLKATFFIIGRDLELPEKAEAIREIDRRGHELASHSWTHRFGLEELEQDALDAEIERTSAAIAALCGRRPVGFRAPGYAAGARVLAACARAGIRYDGSRLPTLIAPLLRYMAGRLRAQVRHEMAELQRAGRVPADFISAADPGTARQYGGGGGLALQTFYPPQGGQPVLRPPLAVSPVLRLPLHASLGMLLGTGFVCSGLRRLARRGQPVTYLLHGMDLLGPDDLAGGRLPQTLARTRPFQAPLGAKTDFLRNVLSTLKTVTHVQLTRDWLP